MLSLVQGVVYHFYPYIGELQKLVHKENASDHLLSIKGSLIRLTPIFFKKSLPRSFILQSPDFCTVVVVNLESTDRDIASVIVPKREEEKARHTIRVVLGGISPLSSLS